MHASQWKGTYEIYESVIASVTGALTATLDNTAVADQGISEALGNVPVVRFAATGHGFALNSFVYISGTANYDGVHQIVAVGTNTFDIAATYAAETPAGTETATFTLDPGRNFQLVEIRVKSDAAVTASENFTVDLDSGHGAAYDANLLTEPMAGLSSMVWVTAASEKRLFSSEDKIVLAFTNTDGNVIGVEAIYRIDG